MFREAFALVNATSGHRSQLELTWLLCVVAFSMASISVIIFACGKSKQKPQEKKDLSSGGGGGGVGGHNLAGAGGFYVDSGSFSGTSSCGGGGESSISCGCGGSGGGDGGCSGCGGGAGAAANLKSRVDEDFVESSEDGVNVVGTRLRTLTQTWELQWDFGQFAGVRWRGNKMEEANVDWWNKLADEGQNRMEEQLLASGGLRLPRMNENESAGR
ncbi:RNA-binding protein cabeza-like [Eucalyptus grandis]|uniref:RNA-binding protein cabeza-like n=1 Tax=Eucalyptus grandis TaxID=71139 RepID=UPI00052513E7|nr:RNA-binding protein cabeza-like [Eucalyptus grandis]